MSILGLENTFAYTSFDFDFPDTTQKETSESTSSSRSGSSDSVDPLLAVSGAFFMIVLVFFEYYLIYLFFKKMAKKIKKSDDASIFNQSASQIISTKNEESEPVPILSPKPKPTPNLEFEQMPVPILAQKPKDVKKITVTAPEQKAIQKKTVAAKENAQASKANEKRPTPKKAIRTTSRAPKTTAKSDIYEIIDVKQRSQRWFDLREGKVTGTAAIHLKNHSVSYAANKSNYRSSYSSYAMERGRKLEPIGISKFADEYGFDVETIGFVNSLVYEKAGFSPDGVIMGDSGEIKTIVEHKAFNRERHLRCARKIEESVMYQIQFGMFVTGAKDAYLVLYNPDLFPYDKELIVKHIHRDGEIMSLFRDRYRNYKINGYAQ